MRYADAYLFGVALGVAVILLLQKIGLAESPPADPTPRAAVVNGEAITLREIDETMKLRPSPINAQSPAQLRQARLEILSTLVDDLLVRQFFRDRGPKADVAEIDRQVAALETSLKTKNKTMADYLREQGQTEFQFRAALQTLSQFDRYVKENTSEKDMRQYYESSKDYFDQTTVRTSHIVIRLASDAPPAEREKARQKLLALRGEIVAGRLDFAKAATAHSQCPSAPKGGDMGFIARKFQDVEEAYARAAFALKVGEISEVVDMAAGVHLIQATERAEGKPTRFEQVAENVRDCYVEDMRMSLLNQLRKKAKVEITLP